MNYKKCVYFVEGPCEKQFLEVLNKLHPYRLAPGKVNTHNVVQELIPQRVINAVPPGTMVVFVFDTDKEKTDVLLQNIRHVKDYVSQVRLVNIAQVLNFEDEIVRATDLKKAQELTKSASVSDFKSDFCRMKEQSCRNALERHHLDLEKMWVKAPPENFSFIKQESDKIKLRLG